MSNPFRPRAVSRLSLLALACAAFGLASCDRAHPPAAAANTAANTAQASADAPESFVAPKDVFERDARAIVGISYPPGLERFPALAKLLVAHADARRAALAAALSSTPRPAVPFELALRFSTAADAPRMFVITADEEFYTGGQGSRPSREVFLWLPAENRLMSPDEMIPNPIAWTRLHEDIRRLQLGESASLAPPPAERAMQHVFVPRFNSSGRIAGLRFRTDEGDEVEVSGADLKPLVAPAFATWFEGAPALANEAAAVAGGTPAPTAKL